MTTQLTKRLDWVDILKFLGILAVYLGHFGKYGGKSYAFVFIYHVPLFFFASGFFASKTKETNFWNFFLNKTKALILPYIFFSIINIILTSINANANAGAIIQMAKPYIYGVRNTIGSLWFLPCIFVMTIGFYLLKRLVKNNYIILVIALILYIITQTILPFRPNATPKWFFNIDSAMYYFVYYALGNVLFNRINNFDYLKLSFIKKIVFICFSIFSIIFTAFAFVGKLQYIIPTEGLSKNVIMFLPILYAIIIIYFNIILAYCISKTSFSQLFASIGRETLILCGTEALIKLLVSNMFIMVGLSIHFSTPLIAYMYTMILLLISNKTVIPLVKGIFALIKNGYNTYKPTLLA